MRTIISLNGTWQIAEGNDPGQPGPFDRTVPVPGLVSLAEPPFPGTKASECGRLEGEARNLPVRDTRRDWFWYRRSIDLDAIPARARLRVGKAQFGLQVRVNGRIVGEHLPCFSSALLDIAPFLKPGRNEIVLRVGAHALVLPPEVPTGSDAEKQIWIPGVYDDVALWLSGEPAITALEVAPDIHTGSAKVRATVRNAGAAAAACTPVIVIRESAGGAEVARWSGPAQALEAGAERQIACEIPIPSPRLWTPESPFLYTLELATGGDAQSARFGLRQLRFDTPTRRAWLNDQVYFLRGSNITLHRFFEDPLCGGLPWDRAWVRKLLQEWPKRLGWNCFRFSIGPVPDFWFDIADEAGLLIENEFFIWGMRKAWSHERVQEHVALWMRDCANHPSVGWWSLSNETWDTGLDAMIGELRRLDLSGRAWNNGYYLPQGPDDPIDDHHYLYYHDCPGADGVQWKIDQFIRTTGPKSVNAPKPSAHATVLNEYGWLWLLRDGTPSLLTWDTYAKLLPEGVGGEERIRMCAEMHGHETRYFRIHRNFAAILHFTFLTADHPNAYTGDLWKDPVRLEMWPAYEDAFVNAFQPVCAHIHYARLQKKAGESEFVPVAMINDLPREAGGEITVRIVDAAGREFSSWKRAWSLPANGQHTWYLHPAFPAAVGHYRVVVEATWDGDRRVVSSSRLEIVPAEAAKPV